ncbi:unnamed protein product [Cuscuta epithymum]|uniref:rRNA methyltransferase YlbH n=1 Tax=Cuscuta epithymum TaxID=186058 RepID=A0AAV0EHL3_9ASTE|nr:unnamed protein product [Cuscuta epithymum]
MAVSSIHCTPVILATLSTQPRPAFNDLIWHFSNPTSVRYLSSGNYRRSPIVTAVSYRSKEELPLDKKSFELLEQHGANLDELLSDRSPKPIKNIKELGKKGKGKNVVPEETKPPRGTHKLLQVLGGKARRRKLLSPKGMDVRPMMEVVKGAAFDILQVAGGCPASLRPGRWLDLYSGTGSVGIEALSRGCSEVHFVEMDPWVVSDVLRPNLESTGFLHVSVIHNVRVENFLEQAVHLVEKYGAFDYVSVTPPYAEVDYGILMHQVANSSVVGDDTFIVVEYPLRTDMPDSCGGLLRVSDRRFGRTHLAIYGPKWAQKRKKVK